MLEPLKVNMMWWWWEGDIMGWWLPGIDQSEFSIHTRDNKLTNDSLVFGQITFTDDTDP